MRHVLPMKPLTSAIRKGPSFFARLKNFVLSFHGLKQAGSAPGPETTSMAFVFVASAAADAASEVPWPAGLSQPATPKSTHAPAKRIATSRAPRRPERGVHGEAFGFIPIPPVDELAASRRRTLVCAAEVEPPDSGRKEKTRDA